MRSNNLTLGEILAYPSQYVIPVFQRYYRWDQPQWDKLWADLADLREPEKTGRHFMGFLVLVPESVGPGEVARYHLIDGQQRLTTLSLVLIALRNAARDAGFTKLTKEVEFKTLVHQFEEGDQRLRVFPKLRDRDDYVACLDGQPPAEGRIGAAVRYFVGRLTTIPEAGTEDGLRAFFHLLTNRLEFIYAQLEGENPFNIFKSLNSTGVPLGPADLIRNFIFMSVPVEKQDEFDAARWRPIERRFTDAQGNLDADAFSAFLRDHLMRDGEYVPNSETFDAFQRHHEATAFDPRRVAAELGQAAEWYQILRGDRPDPSPAVESALAMLRQLESSTTYALLLNLYDRRHRGRLSESDLAEALRLLAGFILRRLVCGESSRGYGRMFVQAAEAIGELPLDELRAFLESRGFPDTPRFVQDFVRFNLYGSRYRKSVLEALERSHKHKEPADLANVQVEHIMPQTLTDTWRTALGPAWELIHAAWLHTPGNLTLTGYNPELTNKPFGEKRQEYLKSNVVITRRLADHSIWGAAVIEQRGRELAEAAATIWPGPAAPIRKAETDAAKPSRFDLRLRFWEGFRDYLKQTGSDLEPSVPKPHHYLRCGRIIPGIGLYAYLNLKNERVAVSAYFYGKEARQPLQALREHRETLEAEIGSKIAWWQSHKDGNGEIGLRNPVDPTDEALWPLYYDWMKRSLERLRDVLLPRVPQPKPNEDQAGEGAEGLSATKRLQLEYWSVLREAMIEAGGMLKPRKPRSVHWTNFSIGRSGFDLAATMNIARHDVAVELVIQGPLASSYFQTLAQEKDAIESEISANLEWCENPSKKACKIMLVRPGVDPSDRAAWPDQHQWLRETLEAFHRVFAPRLKAIEPKAAPGQSVGEEPPGAAPAVTTPQEQAPAGEEADRA